MIFQQDKKIHEEEKKSTIILNVFFQPAEKFDTGTACGECDKYQVGTSRQRLPYQNLYLVVIIQPFPYILVIFWSHIYKKYIYV